MLKAFDELRTELFVATADGAEITGAVSACTAALVEEFEPVLPALVPVVVAVPPVVPVVVPVVVVVWANAPPAKRAEIAAVQRTR